MGELLIPDDDLAADWREAMTQLAHRTHGVFKRHPWLVEHLGDEGEHRAPGGPNGMRHFEQSLKVAALTGLEDIDRIELVALLDDYVFGHVLRAREMAREQEHEEAHIAAMLEYLQAMLATGEYPYIAELAGDDIRASFERLAAYGGNPGRFERGLQRLLDGIELDLGRREPPVEG
jgi:Tetracyclin repressor-like, C-terminal domain